MPLIKITHHPHENEMNSKYLKIVLHVNIVLEEIPSESKFWTLTWLLCFDLLVQEFEFEALGGLCSDNGDY